MYYSGGYVNRVIKKSRKKRGGLVKKIGTKLAGFFIALLIVMWGYIGIVVAMGILMG